MPELLVRHTVDRLLKLDPIAWNTEALAKRDAGKAIAKQAEAKKETARKPGTKPAHKLEDYAGDYASGEFTLKEFSIVRVRFEEEGGKVTGMTLIQPNGVFTATRK